MPRPPRLPRPPAAPKPPRPRVPRPARLAPPRPRGSVELDRRQIRGRGEAVGALAPFVRWDRFLERVRFRQGEMVTIVGTIGSGKTVLERALVQTPAHRTFAVLLGTKPEDKELYVPFERIGFELVDKFDPSPPPAESRVIFRPRVRTPDAAGRRRQAEAFREMLFEVWEAGGWTVVADELFYLTNQLKLDDIFETLWTQGRSSGVTIIGATQLPVSIPLLAFDQATHLFLFRNTDKYRINRMSEFAGADSAVLKALIPVLPRHEFIYVDTRSGLLLRSMVLLS